MGTEEGAGDYRLRPSPGSASHLPANWPPVESPQETGLTGQPTPNPGSKVGPARRKETSKRREGPSLHEPRPQAHMDITGDLNPAGVVAKPGAGSPDGRLREGQSSPQAGGACTWMAPPHWENEGGWAGPGLPPGCAAVLPPDPTTLTKLIPVCPSEVTAAGRAEAGTVYPCPA